LKKTLLDVLGGILGASILLAGSFMDNVNGWLHQFNV
jgi:hypothetical protein